ncbi:hypothetical protein [Seleniivibrio sp.]|uniref:hypothetical protein n=1 Tax=Seleniivibrio sp. TaxID=2898801 RepID=UPI0025E8EA33|nr:hypothetical protein [Seleniivibrio sp.]MCD8552334.1 hypothetical protein [Seleniivibrio sp.]
MDTCAGDYTASGFSPSDTKTGGCGITTPFIISGGTYSMTTVSTGGTTVLSTSLTCSEELILTAEMTAVTLGSCEAMNSLSAMEDPSAGTELFNSLSADGLLTVPSVSGQYLSTDISLSNTLGDFGYTGFINMENPLYPAGLSGSFAVSVPSAAGFVSADTFTVFIDGKDVTKYLTELNISLFDVPSVKASFGIMFKSAKTLSAVINDETFTFGISSVSSSDKSTVLTGLISEPEGSFYAEITGKKASEAAAELSDRIIWAARDFVTTFKGSFTHMSLAQYLADSAGLSVRLLPDGYIAVTDDGSDIELIPTGIFSRTFERTEHKYKTITVNYGAYSSDYVHIIAPSETGTGEAAEIRLYHSGNASLISDSENLTLVSRNVAETVTEDVLFTDGEGTLSVPARSVITAGIGYDGTSVTSRSLNGYRTVTYTTRFDLYTVTETAETKKYVTAVTDSSVTIIFRDGEGSLTKSTPALCDRVSALRLAMNLAYTTNRITLETTHMNGLTTAAGLKLRSRFGSGRVTSAVIKISGSPLRVKNIIEVQP